MMAEPDGRILPALLDELDQAVAVASASGAVIYANRQARLLASSCGLRLESQNALLAASAAQTSQLRRLVRSVCLAGAGGTVRLASPCGTACLSARVSPLSVGEPPRPGLALIVLRRLGGQAAVDPGLLISMFGLTRAEAAILPALIAGKTTNAVARALGLSSHTVRSHVRAVLAKTQTANLRALAMLVSSVTVS